mmetsp:Transcript_50687/g.158343  ORF Transcript_50687/g.158343 Transcript_50687/m.158343 type:complete len:211 (+) Transcript_50687:2101-2733(+)
MLLIDDHPRLSPHQIVLAHVLSLPLAQQRLAPFLIKRQALEAPDRLVHVLARAAVRRHAPPPLCRQRIQRGLGLDAPQTSRALLLGPPPRRVSEPEDLAELVLQVGGLTTQQLQREGKELNRRHLPPVRRRMYAVEGVALLVRQVLPQTHDQVRQHDMPALRAARVGLAPVRMLTVFELPMLQLVHTGREIGVFSCRVRIRQRHHPVCSS